MRASGVHIYVDGRERPLKVLFDYGIWPIDSKEPLRIGADSGLRFQGEIGEVRIYNRALSPDEAAIVAMESPLERARVRAAFLDLNPPADYAAARNDLAALEAERVKLLASIPTVMVMQELPQRRHTFLLKRGADDAPAKKWSPLLQRRCRRSARVGRQTAWALSNGWSTGVIRSPRASPWTATGRCSSALVL